MRILFDTNVVLDVLLRRSPFVGPSARCLNAVEVQTLHGLLGATTITTIYYLLTRSKRTSGAAQREIRSLLHLFDVAPVTRPVLEDALHLDFADYEDAVLHESARHARADGIVTRNTADFATATLSIYTPVELLGMLQAGQQ